MENRQKTINELSTLQSKYIALNFNSYQDIYLIL